MKKITRRKFFISVGCAAATGYLLSRKRTIPVVIHGASASMGHKLRENLRSQPRETEKRDFCIVGGGIAGLCAARELTLKGVSNFTLLELENEVGGNSRSGANSYSAYPWGAHYVPLVNPDNQLTREIFEEFKIITGKQGNLPIYDETNLCAAPQERLFINGAWQEGVVPARGVPDQDLQEIKDFFIEMQRLKQARGVDGKYAFSIPLDASSADPEYRRLDTITMSEYLLQRHWQSPYLHWYANYCCLDDYGVGIERVSAWAGIHYFASRKGIAANAESWSVLTWPEGNGFLVKQLSKRYGQMARSQSLVINIASANGETAVDYLDLRTGVVKRINCDRVIYCAPQFTAPYVLEEWRSARPEYISKFQYSPWLVANLSLSAVPLSSGTSLAWDNVIFRSKSLGYISAKHQNIGMPSDPQVFTYYRPLIESTPAEARRLALERTAQEWGDMIIADLEPTHPDIRSLIERMDVWVWGHGMIMPEPNFLWQDRLRAPRSVANIFFAHSDMSGISIFEEAQYQGVRAVREALGVS